MNAIITGTVGIYLAGIPVAWLLLPGDGNYIDERGRLVYALTWPRTAFVWAVVLWEERA
jgi:hypothetical protein